MVMLTEEAADVIRMLIEAPGAEGLRVSAAEETPKASARLRIEIVGAPAPDDEVIEADGARLFLDSTAAQTLDDKVLHADVKGEQVHFGLLDQSSDSGGEPAPPAPN